MHTGGGRRRGKPRSRILYWFRTPPGVRVGRAALDEDAIRLIEEHNPDVEFDWTRILKGQTTESRPVPTREPRAERPGRRRQQPDAPTVPDSRREPAELGERGDSRQQAFPEPESPPSEPLDEAGVAGDDEPVAESGLGLDPDGEPPAETPTSAAYAKLGSEGLSRLRARYAEVLARISERVQDPAQQDELKTRAERLNPDTWVTDAEVASGLEQYETIFEALRGAIGGGPRRRRNRRRS